MQTTVQRQAEERVALDTVLARGRMRGTVAMLGPAFVAAVAYVDPGNFSTNVSAGAEFGYRLMWVVVLANLMAMPVQYCSAKIGIVTGKSLPELCADRYRPPVRWGLWAQAELIAMATDLAEFVGAALGLHLLFTVPLLPAGLITALVALAVLGLQSYGYRPFERAIAALLLIIMGGLGYELAGISHHSTDAVGGLVPNLPSGDGVFLAVGIIGATVMPHVVYLHSALTRSRVHCRNDIERRRALRFERWDVIIALGLAGLVNLAMMLIAGTLFHNAEYSIRTIDDAHTGLTQLVGGSAALAFAVALLASGISSASVGTLAGQEVMAGFVRLRVPLVLRRLITMVPALTVVAAGVNVTDALNASQVALALGIPFPLIPLCALSRDQSVMGPFANSRILRWIMVAITAVIIVLNALLLYNQLLG